MVTGYPGVEPGQVFEVTEKVAGNLLANRWAEEVKAEDRNPKAEEIQTREPEIETRDPEPARKWIKPKRRPAGSPTPPG